MATIHTEEVLFAVEKQPKDTKSDSIWEEPRRGECICSFPPTLLLAGSWSFIFFVRLPHIPRRGVSCLTSRSQMLLDSMVIGASTSWAKTLTLSSSHVLPCVHVDINLRTDVDKRRALRAGRGTEGSLRSSGAAFYSCIQAVQRDGLPHCWRSTGKCFT